MEPAILAGLQERIAPARAALLIVDMQKDFCIETMATAGTGRDLSRTKAIIPRLARLRRAARDAGVLVVHVGFLTLPDHLSDGGPWLAQRRRSPYANESIAMEGSAGAEFIDELAPEEGEVVVRKHRYSGFAGTDLDLILRARNVATCVVTGVSTNVCVESTFRAAFDLGYYVVVPRDATASWSVELGEAALANVNHRFGLVTSVDEVIAIWREGASAESRARE
jgi:ureidoacrylate peracid hydrolase